MSPRTGAGRLVVATAVIVVGAGVLITLLDDEEYPHAGLVLWWAPQTVTTVGYGDVTPTRLNGRGSWARQ